MVMKVANFLRDSVPGRQQQEPWRGTLGTFPSGIEQVLRPWGPGSCTYKTKMPCPMGSF